MGEEHNQSHANLYQLRRKNTMPIPYVVKLPRKSHKKERKMIVVDGQPYYESTGKNSKCPSIWFPFILLKENRPLDKSNLPVRYKPDFYPRHRKSGYIIKVLRHYLQEEVETLDTDGKDKIIKKRNPLKTTLITAARLTGSLFPESTLIKAKLNEQEIKLARTPLLIEDRPVFSTQDPERINDWLMRQGAPKILSVVVDKSEAMALTHVSRI